MLDLMGLDSWKAGGARALLAGCKALVAVVLLAGCKGADNPSPVQSKNGYSYIPIDGTAFLIPEKSWLKGYANKATDGSVCCIMLHATIPDVQPWSPERNEEMYSKEGIRRNLSVTIWGNRKSWQAYYKKPHEERWRGYVEEPSDQVGIGLRRYRKLRSVYDEKDAAEDTAKYGADFVQGLRDGNGKPYMDTIYYEYTKDGRMVFEVRCSDQRGGLYDDCYLTFPFSESLEVEVYFIRDYLKDAVQMVEKLTVKLEEFEAAGHGYGHGVKGH